MQNAHELRAIYRVAKRRTGRGTPFAKVPPACPQVGYFPRETRLCSRLLGSSLLRLHCHPSPDVPAGGFQHGIQLPRIHGGD